MSKIKAANSEFDSDPDFFCQLGNKYVAVPGIKEFTPDGPPGGCRIVYHDDSFSDVDVPMRTAAIRMSQANKRLNQKLRSHAA